MKKFVDINIRYQMVIIVVIVSGIFILSEIAMYIAFTRILINNTKNYYEESAHSLEKKIHLYLDSIETNSLNAKYIIEKGEFLERGLIYDEEIVKYVTEGVTDINYAFDDNLEMVILYTFDTEPIIIGNKRVTNDMYLQIQSKYKLDQKEHYRSFYTDSMFNQDTNQYYFSFITPIYSGKSAAPVSYLILLYNYNSIRDLFELNNESDSHTITLLLENNQIMTSNQVSETNENEMLLKLIEDESKVDTYITYNDRKYLYLKTNVERSDWTFVSLIPKSEIQKEIIAIVPLGIIITIISIGIIAGASAITINSITVPVEEIVEKLDEIETTETYEDIVTPVKNEVSEIATHINNMMHKIKASNKELLDTQKELYELELTKVQAELSYYQSQINPHFLYNTLESIRSMALVYEAEEIEALSVSMSKIFRYAVKEESIVTIEDEINCIKEYMNIMMLRFPDRYRFDIHIDEEIKKLPIAKMTLQPIVENSFKHGFKGNKMKGYVVVRNVFDREKNYIEIVDTGKGITSATVNQINEDLVSGNTNINGKKGYVGLKNINIRLKLCFGAEYGLKLISKEGCYTKVIVKLPK